MLILGLSDSHDASVTLIENGKVIAAVSEERFTRKKRQQGFPYNSIEYVKIFIRGRNVDKVYVAGKYGRAIFRIFDFIYSRSAPCKNIFSLPSKMAYWLENSLACLPVIRKIESLLGKSLIRKRLRKTGINFISVELLEHHYSHIITALTGMDSENYLAISLDAYGDGKSGLIVSVEGKEVIVLKLISYKDSIAQFYAYISAYLGFKEGDEGKVMALADFGDSSDLLPVFRELFNVDSSGVKVNQIYKRKSFFSQLSAYSNKDIAFALQKVTEEVVLKLIDICVEKNSKPDLFLSGGFFANIKANQRLHETGLFNRIFVFPNMGDGGTSFVSAINRPIRIYPKRRLTGIDEGIFTKLEHVYLGPGYDNEYIKSVLNGNLMDYSEETDIEEKVARLLADGKVVARFNDRLEYGPRALGNRSILYQTTDRTVNKWLNKKLKREEFMPFAPVTLYNFQDKCYVNVKGAEEAARFMTISFNCTEWMKKTSPAVIHVDGTARPQLIKEEDNPRYYRILKVYYEITGIPSLINTSFNMHGEPIVCSPQDAVRTFQAAGIDYLAIGGFLVKNTVSS